MKRLSIIFLGLIVFSITCKGQINNSVDTNPKFQSSLREPVSIHKTGENHYFVDFGKDAFGTLVLNLKQNLEDTIIIHLGEKIKEANKIDRNPGGTIRYQKIILPVTPSKTEYIIQLAADKRNTTGAAIALPDSFGVIMPFRYCELENFKSTPSLKTIKQKVFNYPFNDTSSYFTCSDTILNKIWDLCKYTIKTTSFCGLYVDGERERIPYEADAYINQLGHYSVDQEYGLARRTNEYFINHPTWPTEWILHTVLLFYNDYLYTGNSESLLKNWDALKVKTLIDLEREDGLISVKSPAMNDDFMKRIGFMNNKQRLQDIVDWPGAQKNPNTNVVISEGERDGYDMTNVNTVVNAFHYINLKIMVELAGYLHKKEDAALFIHKSLLVRKSINDKLFNKEKGIYIDGENSTHSSIHANMFPLAFDLVPAEHIKTVTSFIKSRGMACSVYGAQFLLEGLYKNKESDWAINLMTAKNDRSWWNMIRSGSTMAMEAWDMKYKPNSDWNHAWGAAPANIITRYTWGIKPVKPGFEKAEIKPQLSHLSFSKIKVPTPKGPIIASYKKLSNNSKSFTVEIPETMVADFVLIPEENSTVYFNNKKIKPINNTIRLRPGFNLIEVKQ
jgi:alpha-L-rhamnosidase